MKYERRDWQHDRRIERFPPQEEDEEDLVMGGGGKTPGFKKKGRGGTTVLRVSRANIIFSAAKADLLA